MARWDPRATLCGNCGHWSESSESGLSPGVGFCAFWDKLRDRDDTCDHFVTRSQYQKWQAQLAEENEEWLED